MLTSLASSPLRLVGWAALFLLLRAPGDLKLKENDHKKLSQVINTYFNALDEKKDITEKLKLVLDQIDSAEKRLKGQKLLASVGDWEQVFRLVQEARLKETLKKKGEVAETKVKADNGIEVAFAYSVPKKPVKGALPLLLCIPDKDEAPTAHLNSYWNDPVLRESAVLMAVKMELDSQVWGQVGSREAPMGAFKVMSALSIISSEFSIDANRTYLVGAGQGFAAVEITAASFPHVWAGLIGIGNVAATDLGNLGNFRALSILLLKGGEGAQAISKKAQELGYPNCELNTEGGTKEAWAWIEKTPRVAHPAQISFSPKSDYGRRAYWLSLGGIQVSENPHIEAKADRASNTITVDTQKVSDLVIYLNDELVDMDKPVRFVVNGTTHEQTVDRNAPEMIKNQFFNGDWGRVFTNSVTQDVPAKK